MSQRVRRAWRAMEPGAWAHMLERWASRLDDEEITVVNLETPLVDDVVPLRTGWPPVLGAPPGLAGALAAAGVDVVSLANNHAYDQGHLGLARTRALLEEAGLRHAGAGVDVQAAYAPAIVERGGVRVAVISATALMNLRPGAAGARPIHVARLWDERRVVGALERARRVADVVVLCAHWSVDFAREPTAAQRRTARRFVDAGADLILGAGPHVLHPVERLQSPRGEAVIAYSLGNLLSSMAPRWQPGDPPPRGAVHPANVTVAARDGVLLRTTFTVDSDGRVAVTGLSALPLWTVYTERAHDETGAPLELRVIPLSEAPAAVREARETALRSALGDAVRFED